MRKKLNAREYLAVAIMLFGMFFGAGNLIFPVFMGWQAGRNVWGAILGFIVTGVGLPLMGVAAIGISRSDGLVELSGKVSRPYSVFFTCALYLTIGPCFAIPRCAATPFTVVVSGLMSGVNERLALLIFSLLCALVYSRYITRPIVRLSGIAGRMSELDFNWECPEQRRDEIGALGRSLNCMSRRLSTALSDLEEANHALRGEVEQERELDRQRMAFFSAASHELKTPVTILKGQLTGMLDGVGVYRDRDKYLLRSLQVTGRMENLIQEMLSISRMETGSVPLIQESVGLSELIENQLSLDAQLLEQRGQTLVTALTPGVNIIGDPSLLGKAVGNLLSNASLYSPEGAEVRVWCGYIEQRPALTVENTGAHIQDEALPHLFEAFYREDGSRSRSTGGSGLGLYIVRMILQRHGAGCTIENTAGGVRATVVFSP